MNARALIVTALLASPAGATPALRDFELPPGPSATPTTAAPQVQGPVDPETPAATRPRPAPAATAQAPEPTVAPTIAPTGAPAIEPPATDQPRPPYRPRETATGTSASPAPDRPEPVDVDLPVPATTTGAQAPSDAPVARSSSPPIATEPVAGTPWLAPIAGLMAGGIAVLAGLVAYLRWRRRRRAAASTAPQIQPPPARTDHPGEPVSPPARLPHATASVLLQIEATPSHLTRSMMAATLSCRVSLINRGAQPIEDVTLGVDLTTAHGSVPRAELLANPSRPMPEAGRIARIAPGETVEIAQDVRLPTTEIRTLRQGHARLYVPLLRVRAQAGERVAIARTFLVGTLPDPGARKLQPFRLDELPQTYRLIGVTALD